MKAFLRDADGQMAQMAKVLPAISSSERQHVAVVSTEMAPPAAGKNMAADDVPVAADELEGQDSGHVIVPLKSTKSFHSKSLGEGDKTGVQVRQNPSPQGFP